MILTNMPGRVILAPMLAANRFSMFVVPFVIFIGIVFASLALNRVDYNWAAWRPATCMPDNCFCEALRDGVIRQPVNTYSNLTFVLAGIGMLAIAREDWACGKRGNLLLSHRAYSSVFGVAAIVIGAGSFFYHASLTFIGQWFDVMGMDLFIGFALVYNYARFRPLRTSRFVLAYIAMMAMLGYMLIVTPEYRRQVFAALVWATLALELLVRMVERPQMQTRWLVASVASLAMGYGIWMLDESGVWCTPTSIVQGHALWHLFSALAAFLLYWYYRSEQGGAN